MQGILEQTRVLLSDDTGVLSDQGGDISMATRLRKKDGPEETPQPAPSQHQQAEGRFRLKVDRQTKSTYATLDAAEAAGLAIKKEHPIVQVAVYDHLECIDRIIQTPEP
jgi:hypothetical protein